MKPYKKLGSTGTPDGGELGLYQHDRDFEIKINGQLLMSSRQHESELALARYGCAHLSKRKAPRVLIGGLGLGYTTRQTLDMLAQDAKVIVSELLAPVVVWNRDFLSELNGRPLEDKRTEIIIGDIFTQLRNSIAGFDAILLDVDNGPSTITDAGNDQLYTPAGIEICRRALRVGGCLAIWTPEPSVDFERLLMNGGFHVRRYHVPAYKGTDRNSRFIWVAAERGASLPPGGAEPNRSGKKKRRG